jgi:uncharacterized RDD family membrane protein YckC
MPLGGQPPNQAYAQAPLGPYRYSAGELASWGQRVAASLIDLVVYLAPGIVAALLIGLSVAITGADEPPAAVAILGLLLILSTIVVFYWNRVFRQGRTGQSLGKSALNITLISANTRQPVGAWRAFLREFLSGLFGQLCFVNYLWPVWDDQKQTWHDKVMDTVVVKL